MRYYPRPEKTNKIKKKPVLDTKSRNIASDIKCDDVCLLRGPRSIDRRRCGNATPGSRRHTPASVGDVCEIIGAVWMVYGRFSVITVR